MSRYVLRPARETEAGYQAFWANDAPGILSHMEQALDWIPQEWWHARVEARLFLAGGYHMLGDPASAAATLSTSFAEAQANGPYLMRSFMITCFIHWLAGDLQSMEDAANQVPALGEQHHYPQTANWARYFKGIVQYHRNQLVEAEQAFSAVVLDRYRTHLQCLVHGPIALAFTYQAQQRPAQALIMAEMIPAFLYEKGNTILMPVVHAFQADLARRQGRLAEASQWAAQTQPAALNLMPHFFAQHLVLPTVLRAADAAAAEGIALVGCDSWQRDLDGLGMDGYLAGRTDGRDKRLRFLAGRAMKQLKGRAPAKDVAAYLAGRLEEIAR